MNRVAVIGGSGFIGARLVEALGGALVIDRAAASANSGALKIDVRDGDALARALEGRDTVYLLAAEHRDDVQPSSLYYDVNVGGAEHVIRAAELHGINRIIFTSTMAIYSLDSPNAGEDTPGAPFNDYGKSKWQAERRLVEWAGADPSRSLGIVRPCVVFGEGNRGNVYNLLYQIHTGRFVQVGSGRNRKSMAYVGNLAEFLKGMVDAPPGIQAFNYADKPDLTMRELISLASDELSVRLPRFAVPYPVGLTVGYGFDALARVTRRRFPISSVRVQKFCAETTVNTARLESTGFKPPYTLEEGLRRMIRAEFSSIGIDRN